MSHEISQAERERRQRYKEKCQEILASINRLLDTAETAVDNNDYKILKEILELLPRKKSDLLLEISMLWNQPFIRWYGDLKFIDDMMDSANSRMWRFLAEYEKDQENMTEDEKFLMKDVIRIIKQHKGKFENEQMDPYNILY